MKDLSPKQMYELLKGVPKKYNEERHCVMILDILPKKWRISAFCLEAGIMESTFYNWVNRHETFKICYCIAQMLAQEEWEKEEEDNQSNPDWDRKTWLQKGSRYFAKDKSKLKLEVNCESTPWEQYKQILKQAEKGDFTASEIKQLMESVNVGTRVFEAFKLQEEVDNMKRDLIEMSQRNGDHTSTIIKIEDAD